MSQPTEPKMGAKGGGEWNLVVNNVATTTRTTTTSGGVLDFSNKTTNPTYFLGPVLGTCFSPNFDPFSTHFSFVNIDKIGRF